MALNIRHSAALWTPPAGPGLAAPPSGAVLTGLSRTTYTGSNPVSANNVTITRKNFNDTLVVSGSNCTITDCYFDAGSGWGIDADGATGLTVDHCTITGAQYNNSCILTGDNWEVLNCVLTGYENALMIQGGTGLAEGNYCHTLGGPPPDPHVDGFQIAGPCNGVIIRGNWIESWDTSCIIIKADAGDITNVTVTGNTLKNKTGQQTAYCIYTYAVGANSVSNVTVTNNRLQRGNGGYHADEGATGTVWTGNVDYVTGLPVAAET
jgi:hypothetical protein